MNQKVLRTLEFDKIIKKLADKATCEVGRRLCYELKPISDLRYIELAQDETEAAFNRIVKFNDFSCQGIVEPHEYLARLKTGGVLNTTELMYVASLLEVAKRAYAYNEEMEENRDALSNHFGNLFLHNQILDEIRRCIIAEDTIADDASPKLANIRHRLMGMGDRIRAELNKMVNNATIRSYLQDSVITQRDGRYCLPVRADAKSSVPGMVHDQSATGSTFFIEPMAVVNLNNELRELQLAEIEEIERILAELSNQVAAVTDDIIFDFEALSRIDFIFSKARLALDENAIKPIFNTDGIIELRKARHPLLNRDTVVPVDLTLGDEYNLLLVTGPNTGGKTVSLKTCGLLSLMAQAGLHIPAADRSRVCLFDDVFADIGDEQSIEASLSTFSSHMTNIVRILNSIDKGFEQAGLDGKNPPQYLVLLDELCAGTDPKEGAAIATSILDRLHTLGVRTMSTTHYSELKIYALSTEGVENASCEFSLETLSPTYRLIIGIPGKSNAFAISGKLGLSSEILDNAKSRLSDDDISMEDMLIDIENKRHEIEQMSIDIKKTKADIDKKQADINEKTAKLHESKDKILRDANEKASNILMHAKELADSTIRDFNKYGSSNNVDIAKMEKKRQNVGKELKQVQKKSTIADKVIRNTNVPKELHIGDKVKVLSMDLSGNVCSLPNAKGDFMVQMGIMKSSVNIKDVILIKEESAFVPKKGSGKSGRTYGGLSKAATISPEINLLGCTADEAISRLDKYIDDAYLAHLSTVRVVHGKGTGVLRTTVTNYLKKHPQVKSYKLGEFGEGDAGVTIVEFK